MEYDRGAQIFACDGMIRSDWIERDVIIRSSPPISYMICACGIFSVMDVGEKRRADKL